MQTFIHVVVQISRTCVHAYANTSLRSISPESTQYAIMDAVGGVVGMSSNVRNHCAYSINHCLCYRFDSASNSFSFLVNVGRAGSKPVRKIAVLVNPAGAQSCKEGMEQRDLLFSI